MSYRGLYIDLSLNENIYYSAVLKKMVIHSVAAPSPSYELYSVDDSGCTSLGYTDNETYSPGSTGAVDDILSGKTAQSCKF
jgi:hypothetical protein